MTIKKIIYPASLSLAILIMPGCSTSVQEVTSPVGPEWEKTGPGGGGAVFIPTFSYESADKFLLRCDMTGSYLSEDGGDSYSQIDFAGGASSFAWDQSSPDIIYIGSACLNRSDDGGRTWKCVFPCSTDIKGEQFLGDHADYSVITRDKSLYDSVSGRIGAIRTDPFNPGHVYFSMGPYFYFPDNSASKWQRISVGEEITYIYTGKSVPGGAIYIFTGSSLYVFDKATRKVAGKKLPEAMSPAFSFTGGTVKEQDVIVFYAIHHDTALEIRGEFGHSEVWKSADLGNTWTQITDTVVTNDVAGIKPSYSMITCAEYDAGRVYLISNRYEEKTDRGGYKYWYGALSTADGGNSWKWVWKGGGGSGKYGVKDGIGVENLDDAWVEKAFGGEYIRLMDVGVAPSDGKIAIVTDWYRTMKTTDGGETWKEIYSARQPDGTYTSRGLDVTTAYGVHFDPFDSNHIAISYTDIGYFQSFNRGKSWMRSAGGVPPEWINTCYWMVFDPEVKGKVWSVWSNLHDFPRGKMTRNPGWKKAGRGGVCISTDGGNTWTPTVEGMGFDSPATSIVIDPDSPPGNRTLFTAVYGKGVFRSDNDGKTWEMKNNGIDENRCAFELTLTGKGVLFLTVSATPAHRDNKKGREFFSGAVYRSVDKAETWTRLRVTDGLLFPNGMDYDREDPDRLYLACWADIYLSDLIGGDVVRATGKNEILEMPGGIFMSVDGGDTWQSIFNNQEYVYDVTVDPFHKGRLYCNTFNQAAYRSNDYGSSWHRINGYDFQWGQRIIPDSNDPESVFITTFGSSVWHGIPETETGN